MESDSESDVNQELRCRVALLAKSSGKHWDAACAGRARTFSTHVLEVPVDVVESYPCTACAQVTAVSGSFGEHLHGVSAMDERAQGANLCDIICPDVSENRYFDLQVANLRQLQVPKDKGGVSVLCPTVFPSTKERCQCQ